MGYRIMERKMLGPDSVLFVIKAPYVAKSTKPGQFIILRVSDKGERIPLTIANADKEKGMVTIIFQIVGKTTRDLSFLKVGDEICDFLGPLGVPTEIEKFGCVAMVGGGFGTAVLYPLIKALKKADNYIVTINGARNKNLLILEEELKKLSDEYYVTTDDGSKGFKGFVTNLLEKFIEKEGKKVDRVFAVGPVPMMRAVSKLTKVHSIKTIVSLNSIMVDGTGMCGSCRVEVDGQTKFACVDGPDFDAHKINFDLLAKRLQTYKKEEALSLSKICCNKQEKKDNE